jgi:hypothetical protein
MLAEHYFVPCNKIHTPIGLAASKIHFLSKSGKIILIVTGTHWKAI